MSFHAGVDVLDRDRPAEAEGLAARALPAQLAYEAAADLEQAAGLLLTTRGTAARRAG
jgi:hypothetical protein